MHGGSLINYIWTLMCSILFSFKYLHLHTQFQMDLFNWTFLTSDKFVFIWCKGKKPISCADKVLLLVWKNHEGN